MTKCIENLTYGEIKELMGLFGNKQSSSNLSFWKVGENYFIRTVTMIIVGRLEAIDDKEIHLSSAAWIADTGRFYNALKEGKLNEVEPFTNDVVVGRGSLVDATSWTHKLPKEQK